MDSSDWVVVLAAAVFLPLFLIGLFRFGRGSTLLFGGELRMSPPTTDLTPRERLEEMCREISGRTPECTVADGGGLRFVRRGLQGRLDFVSDRTEILIDPQDLVRQVVEVVPIGFPISWFSPPGKDRLRARGSKAEYDRIFRTPAEAQVLVEIGVPYELRMGPDGIRLRILALPQNGPALGHWLGCAFRLVDLLPGIDAARSVEVTGVHQEVTEATLCQICGSTLAAGALVRCVLCRTPHHEDCWQYARKCSTFGCTSPRWTR